MKLPMSIFKVRLSWHVSKRILYMKNTHPHRHEFYTSAQTRNTSIVHLSSTPFLPRLGFFFVRVLQFALFFVSVACDCVFAFSSKSHWSSPLTLSWRVLMQEMQHLRSHDLFDFDCGTGEFRLETHKPYHSGCPMEMTPFEAHKCKGPVMSEKANGNRRAKFGGNRKPRARGDHACHTYQRGFWR